MIEQWQRHQNVIYPHSNRIVQIRILTTKNCIYSRAKQIDKWTKNWNCEHLLPEKRSSASSVESSCMEVLMLKYPFCSTPKRINWNSDFRKRKIERGRDSADPRLCIRPMAAVVGEVCQQAEAEAEAEAVAIRSAAALL